jgi:hypothetical protein
MAAVLRLYWRMQNVRVAISICVLSFCMASGGQILPSSPLARANDPSCGMIYGQDHMLLLCAPPGWVLDNKALADKGIYAAFYRKELSYEEAEKRSTLMYVNVQLKGKGQQTALEAMKTDAERTKLESPKLVIQREAPIVVLGDKHAKPKQVPVQTFLNDFGGGYESVAYIEDEKTVTMIVISSVSKPILHNDYPAFVRLVKSYVSVGQDEGPGK